MNGFLSSLRRYLRLSEEDIAVAGLFALGGYGIDVLFFLGGIPPGAVSALYAAGGLFGSRFLKSRKWYLRYRLRIIDLLVSQGHLSEEDEEAYKKRLIHNWMKGIRPSDKDDPADST